VFYGAFTFLCRLRYISDMKAIQFKPLYVLGLVGLALSLSGCPTNDPYAPSPYDRAPYDRGYGYDYNRDEYYRERDYDRKRDLERERERLERERERLERERQKNEWQRNDSGWQRNPPPQPRQERCPSGFSPSERKCSQEERRRGCRDMRLPGGLGCVSR
jgi:hypothetical protein